MQDKIPILDDIIVFTFIVVFLMIGIILYFFTRNIKIKIEFSPRLVIAIVFGLVSICMFIIGYTFPEFQFVGGTLSVVVFDVVLLLIYFHYNELSPKLTHFWRDKLFIACFSFIIAVELFSLLDWVPMVQNKVIMGNILVFSYFILVSSYIIYLNINAYNISRNTSNIREIVTFGCFILGALLYIVANFVLISTNSSQGTMLYQFLFLCASVFFLAGVFLFLYNFMVDPYHISQNPILVYNIFIIHDSGIPLYTKSFQDLDQTRLNELSLSGILTIISNIIQQSLRADLWHIDAKGFSLFFTSLTEQYKLVIVSDGFNKFFLKHIEKLSASIPTDLFENVKNFKLDSAFEGLVDIYIHKSLPFLTR